MPELDTQDPVKPPLLKSLRGRQAIFAAWLNTAPFVKSFVEEEERGNAKKTRSNTLANRRNTSAYSGYDANYVHHSHLTKKVSHSTVSSHDSKSTSTIASSSDLERSRRNISFANEVTVYADVKEAVPVVKKVKSHPDGSPKIAHRRPTARVINQFAPTSTAGKWIVQKTATGTTTYLG